MQVLRILIFFLFGVSVVELAGYYLVSDQFLVSEVVQHYQPTTLEEHTGSINIYSNYQLNEVQKKDYASVYRKEGIRKDNIRFFTDVPSFEQFIDRQDNYNYVLDVNFNAVPFAVVEEGENTLGNTAIWQSKYIWCLYRWILIRKEKPAQPAGWGEQQLQTLGI